MCGFRVNSDCHGSKLIAEAAASILQEHARVPLFSTPSSSSSLLSTAELICNLQRMHSGLMLLGQKSVLPIAQLHYLLPCHLRMYAAYNAVIIAYMHHDHSPPCLVINAIHVRSLVCSSYGRRRRRASSIITRSFQSEHA